MLVDLHSIERQIEDLCEAALARIVDCVKGHAPRDVDLDDGGLGGLQNGGHGRF